MPKRSLRQQDFLGNSWPTMMPPVITPPPVGILSVLLGLNLSLATPSIVDGPDTAVSTTWEVRTAPNGGGSLVWTNTITNPLQLLSALVPALTLPLGQTLYIRAKQTCGILGTSPWSVDVVINT